MATGNISITFSVKIAWWHKLLLPLWALQVKLGKDLWFPSGMIKMESK